MLRQGVISRHFRDLGRHQPSGGLDEYPLIDHLLEQRRVKGSRDGGLELLVARVVVAGAGVGVGVGGHGVNSDGICGPWIQRLPS